MKQEDKELLFKDLCSRLPYGIKVKLIPLPNNEYVEHLYFNAKVTKIDIDYIEVLSENGWFLMQDITEIRPYLFPLSSMTEKQHKEWLYTLSSDCHITYDTVDWLNKNHFDYRGLIEKGLAADATNLNIY